jgi:2-succinyl-6-hydroxy-2,4-cyclohexadiene-1-carboxylate synthase
VVLLHGFLGRGASWRAVLDDPQLRGVDVFAPDLPGHGDEPAPRDFLDAVATLSLRISHRQFGRGSAVVAGYSLGGRLALGMMMDFRLGFPALLIGISPGLKTSERPARAASDALLAAQLRRDGLPAFVEDWRKQPLFASQSRLPAALLAEQAVINQAHSAPALADALERLSPGNMPDYRPRLGSIKVPVTVQVGGEDAKFLEPARRLHEQIPNSRLDVVPGAGHNLLLEAPEVVAAGIARLARMRF